MSATKPIIHFVGSIPLPDSETVFKTLAQSAGAHLARLPDGETGIRKSWIRFLQDVLAENPAIELATDAPPFQFKQWDGKVVREIPRLRIKPGQVPASRGFVTHYGDMAIASWKIFEQMQKAGAIPAGVKFQVSLPTPIAPTYNNMVPADRPRTLSALVDHFQGEVAKMVAAIPNDKLAIQWDVCQEVLAWEGYYDAGPVDFRTEAIDVLTKIGDAIPRQVELGYHLCYGSPADEHMVQPKDAGLMVEMVNAVSDSVKRPIEFFHLPVPKPRTDEAFYVPLERLNMKPGTDLYLGLIHRDDEAGNASRLATAKRHAKVDGIGTECGMARGNPATFPDLLAAHKKLADAKV
ncbi:MAG TPA: hypothetical protein VHY80_16040 [Stellaceae bacterium]|nr:hypothetical protein [Stellaceae bacterium]